MITVIGGCYREVCLRPAWNQLFGSGVRADRLAVVANLGEARAMSLPLGGREPVGGIRRRSSAASYWSASGPRWSSSRTASRGPRL